MRYIVFLLFYFFLFSTQAQENCDERVKIETDKLNKYRYEMKSCLSRDRVALTKESEIKSAEIARLSTALRSQGNQNLALMGGILLLTAGNFYFFRKSRKIA